MAHWFQHHQTSVDVHTSQPILAESPLVKSHPSIFACVRPPPRAKFRVNAANRTEGFCTLEGLPSDLLVRGDVNQNRAVEGDEVAVLAFKLTDWFKVYKEQEKVGLGFRVSSDVSKLQTCAVWPVCCDQVCRLA